MTDINFRDTELIPVYEHVNWRKWAYPIVLTIIYFIWISYMFGAQKWHLMAEHWTISLTMAFGSLVSGATAEGGGAIAFPVFTKVLEIAPSDARTFGLMIQAVGMSTATFVIYLNRIKVLGTVIFWASIGGFIGQIIGTYFLVIPEPYPRILFTLVAGMFGVTMLIQILLDKSGSRHHLPYWTNDMAALFITTGIIGGIFTAQTGAGVDMMVFIVLTLVFRMNIKISTPTTIVIMAINSIAGFYLHGVISQDIGIVWEYWLMAIPIVVVGAPLGTYIASKVHHNVIAVILLSLIALEVITTMWLIPFNNQQLIVTGITVVAISICFAGLIHLRHTIYGS